MDDAGTGPPETDAITRRTRTKKAVDLGVRRSRRRHVGVRSTIRLDQVVAVHRRGNRRFVLARLHELEQRHLRRRILHRDAIGTQKKVRIAGDEFLPTRVVEMAEQNLFGVGQRTTETLSHDLEIGVQRFINGLHEGGGRLDSGHGRSPDAGEAIAGAP